MANPDALDVTPGSGAKVATFKITEAGQDRHLQRFTPSTDTGEEVAVGSAISIDVSVQRPANTLPYTALDAFADATPTVGGYAFTGASRGAGKCGLITDLLVFGSAVGSPQLQADLFLFDQAVTAIADNAAFTLANATELKRMVARISFTLEGVGGFSFAEITNVNQGFTTVGTGNLYGLIRVNNAYVPANGEQLSFRLKTIRTN